METKGPLGLATRSAALLALILGTSLLRTGAQGSSAQPHAPQNAPGLPPDPWTTDLDVFSLHSRLRDGRLWLVMFHVPWCRGCKRMAGQWAELGEAVSSYPDVALARFDCMQDEGLCERLGVDRTPTLQLYLYGEHVETYKADFYHVDLMRPFLERMRIKYGTAESYGKKPAAGAAAATIGGAATGAAEASRPAGPAGVGNDAGGGVIEATKVEPGVYDRPAGSHAARGEKSCSLDDQMLDIDTGDVVGCGSGGANPLPDAREMPAGGVADGAPDVGGTTTAHVHLQAAQGQGQGQGQGEGQGEEQGQGQGQGQGEEQGGLSRVGRGGGPSMAALQQDREEL